MMGGINPKALKKLSVEDIRQMREMRMRGVDVDIISKVFNICRTTTIWHTDSFAPKIDLTDYPFAYPPSKYGDKE